MSSHPCTIFRFAWLILFCSGLCSDPVANAQTEDDEVAEHGLPNLPLPTLGGKQFWTDHLWRNGWRLQRNALTQHWRLLNESNVRQAWGSRAACEERLQLLQPTVRVPAVRAILLMHGLGRTSGSMKSLKRVLESAGLETVICLEYASSRESISQHATALQEVVAGLPDHVRLDFVGHSMGNIVVRHALGDWQRANAAQVLDRIDHVVMLGPPNQGASIARQLAKTGVFGWVAGEGGLELGSKWQELESKLATPHCPFGIVAGKLSGHPISNPLVDGASDFVVSVEETKLPGAADFLEVPVLHSFLMDDPIVQQAVVRFLNTGKFQ